MDCPGAVPTRASTTAPGQLREGTYGTSRLPKVHGAEQDPCSPYRVPVARLAAAQAKLADSSES